MAMEQSQHRQQMCLCLLLMMLFTATVGQQTPCASQEAEMFGPKTFTDEKDSVKVANQYAFEAEEDKILPQSIKANIIKELSSANVKEKLGALKGMETVRDAVEKASSDKSLTTASKYHPTCPEVKIWLRPGYYYWRYIYTSTTSTTYKYCYNYWSIYMIECACNYCRINSSHYYDRRYKCLEEYRFELVPMLCYVVVVPKAGQPQVKPYWDKIIYRYIRLPKDCCCSYYNHYLYKQNLDCAQPYH